MYLYLMRRFQQHSRQGFTLVELLIVVAIIAILGAIVFTNLSQENQTRIAQMTNMATAQDAEISARQNGMFGPEVTRSWDMFEIAAAGCDTWQGYDRAFSVKGVDWEQKPMQGIACCHDEEKDDNDWITQNKGCDFTRK